MLKASCCGQYICDTCAIAFLKGKSIDCDSAALLGRLPPTECPYCTDTGLKFEQVHASELARNYEDSPAVAQKLASRVPKQEPGAPSPLKSGDTYEDKVAARKEEIESLQEALKILNGEDLAGWGF